MAAAAHCSPSPCAGRAIDIVRAGVIGSIVAFGDVSAKAAEFIDRHDATTTRYQRMNTSASRRDESASPGTDSARADTAPSGEAGRSGRIGRKLRAIFRPSRDEAEPAEPAPEPEDEVESAERESTVDRSIIDNALRFGRSTIDDVMVPRAEIVAVPETAPLAEVLQAFLTAGHSRLPVYAGTLDDPKGMVHIRDLLEYIASNGIGAEDEGASAQGEGASAEGEGERADADRPLAMPDLSVSLEAAGIVRPVLFAPASMPVPALLARMKVSRTHMALVVDEYGGTDGLVSLEDLVELVVGEIEDEHDQEVEPEITQIDERTFAADARASLEAVFEAMGEPPPGDDVADEVDTIGGYVMSVAGRLPEIGEVIAMDERFEAEIVDADPRRLQRIRIRRLA